MWIPRLARADPDATLDFPIVLASDHKSPAPAGTTPTLIRVFRNGASAWTAPSGTFAEVGTGDGRFRVGATADGADVSTLGPLALHVEATDCDPTNWVYFVVEHEDDEPYRQHVTTYPFLFFVAQAGTALGLAGATVTVQLLKVESGGGFAAATGTVFELGGAGNGFGWYGLQPSAADVDTAGVFVLRPSAAGGEAADYEFDLPPGPPSGSHASIGAAILGRWNADAGLLAAIGPLWHIEAPEGTELPYATYMEVSDAETETTGDPHLETAVYQFSVHANPSARAKALGRLVKTAYRKAPLVVDGLPVMHCLRVGGLLVKGEGKGPKGEDSWMQTHDFEVMRALSS